jgi:hypothetical protein
MPPRGAMRSAPEPVGRRREASGQSSEYHGLGRLQGQIMVMAAQSSSGAGAHAGKDSRATYASACLYNK